MKTALSFVFACHFALLCAPLLAHKSVYLDIIDDESILNPKDDGEFIDWLKILAEDTAVPSGIIARFDGEKEVMTFETKKLTNQMLERLRYSLCGDEFNIERIEILFSPVSEKLIVIIISDEDENVYITIPVIDQTV